MALSATTDPEFVLDTLRQLVQINSVNPSVSPSGHGEAAIVAFAARLLKKMGVEVCIYTHGETRASVVGILRGSGGGKSLMLNAHIDTVGVEDMKAPFDPAVRNGRLYGRGAYDMKGSAAACLGALAALVEVRSELRGDVLVALVGDEEYASEGTSTVIEHHTVDAAIVTEPSQLNICLAHKGFVWVEVTTEGRAYHGSQFTEGIDANLMMGRFLSRLDKLEKDLRARRPHALLGPPSIHAPLISGGTGISTYSASCTLKIERRTVPGETESSVRSELQAIIDALSAEDGEFKATLQTLLVRDPFEVASDAPVVTALRSAAAGIMQRTPPDIGENPWMDAALLANAGAEVVVFGPEGAGAHSHEEFVELQSVYDLAQILTDTALAYAGNSIETSAALQS